MVELLLDMGAEEAQLTLDTTLDDLKFNDMDVTEIAVALEHIYRLRPFSDRVLDTWPAMTIGQLIKTLRTLGAQI